MTNWQAYEDGSMDKVQRKDLTNRLSTDPSLQKEWKAFQNFRSVLTQTLSSPSIDPSRFDSFMGQFSRAERPLRWLPLSLAAGLSAVFAAILFIANEGIRPNVFVSNPVASREWIRENAGINFNADLTNEGKLAGVDLLNNACTYHYLVNGASYDVTIYKGQFRFLTNAIHLKPIDGKIYSDCDSYGFQSKGIAVRITGPDQEVERQMAVRLQAVNKN